ncbi:hypothetical protein ACMFMG_006224 [Clarireedia jacksonii]
MSGEGFNPYHGGDSGPLPYMPHTGFAFPTASFGLGVPYGGFTPAGYGMPGQYPAPPPTTDGGVPGIHIRNQSGGIGLPPGYNYLFPKEHSLTPLWNYDGRNHKKFFVPAGMTVEEMMKALGCNNETADKNVMTEVTEAGNGKWLKGMKFSGGDKERMKKKLTDLGWDIRRRKLTGQSLVVWVYVTND